MQTLVLKSVGTHSFEFQYPFALEPVICPMRTVTGFNGVFSAAAAKIISQTHLDSLYPKPAAEAAST